MQTEAILLLVLAAFMHAGWNLLSRSSRDKQAFLWLAEVTVLIVFLLPVVYLYRPVAVEGWACVALSGLFESIYFVLLAKAYELGDLSLVYPVARGSAPLFVTLFASVALGERVSLQGVAGILLVVAGIYTANIRSSGPRVRSLCTPLLSLREKPVGLAVLTGMAIASYSVVDKVGIRYAHPLVYTYLVLLVSTLMLAPYVLLTKRGLIVREWQAGRLSIVAVAVMTVLAFVLVLTAMSFSKVSYVSAVREMSVVVAALLGVLVLREPFGMTRVVGSALIFAGVFCIGLAK
jgi:drug/metabolite transporter (DMT)-like permease